MSNDCKECINNYWLYKNRSDYRQLSDEKKAEYYKAYEDLFKNGAIPQEFDHSKTIGSWSDIDEGR